VTWQTPQGGLRITAATRAIGFLAGIWSSRVWVAAHRAAGGGCGVAAGARVQGPDVGWPRGWVRD
jgi:hypothetical protein